jgi:putative ABC transport system ATP-binding protein
MCPLRFRDVVKRYGNDRPALCGVSFDVASGQFVAVLGPSGCGKSTLLHLAGCVDLPTEGTVEIEGRATSGMNDEALTALRRERIGIVFQFFNLLPTLTLAENVALPLVLQRRPQAEIERRVRAVLDLVEIGSLARRYPSEVSGGEVQRAAVARAVVHEPAIVLADEPTGNLDSERGAAVLRILRALADAGQTVVMATHSREAASIADRAIVLRDGTIVAQ